MERAMTEFSRLEVFDCPLEGINLIEASAGTGKTWNLSWLYLRLLLERDLRVPDILVVTFTKAATAELRDRIRARIVESLEGLEQGERGETPDKTLAEFLKRLQQRGLTPEQLRDRLELARENFDDAAIHTIHGFCQRALADTPFSAGLPFELEAVQDDAERLLQAIRDFWRRRIADPAGGLSSEMARYLRDRKDSPESWAELLKPVVGKPLAEQRWPEDLADAPEPDESALERAFAAARAVWETDGSGAVGRVLAALASGALKKNIYKEEGIAQAQGDWDRWLLGGQPTRCGPRASKQKLELFSAEKLSGSITKGNAPPAHAFFTAAGALLKASADFDQALSLARLRLLRDLVESVPAALRDEKRRQRVVSFDDMLANLHRALEADAPRPGPGAEALAAALRRRFPAALIDEFQDTDPLQFGIFLRIYRGQPGPLFLVGDPKQAIYRFRNADLHTYLKAEGEARHHYSLPANQRSVTGLIDGCNVLFGAHDRAFLQAGIVFRPVEPGEKQTQLGFPALEDRSAEARAALQVWLLPRGAEGRRIHRNAAKPLCARVTAAEIARLLAEAGAGRIRLGNGPLTAADIAVLVRSHGQGRIMREALAERGIACVELSQASVFATLEAEELARILLAIAERRDNLLRAALATDLLGYDAAAIDGFVRDEADFFRHLERFAAYRDLWAQRGFAVMFRRLLREEGVEARLLAAPRGERRLTDVLHLGELLAQAAREHAGVDTLLRWFQAQRQQAMVDDNAQLRLESDSERVQIVTIHKSKGLEYPVVFCPFLWDGFQRAASGPADLLEYHEDGRTVLDFDPASRGSDEIKGLIREEEAAETLRLIYVALTRAVQRCYLIAGLYERAAGRGQPTPDESTRSLLNWLVAGGGWEPADWLNSQKKRDADLIEAIWRELPGRAESGGLAVADLPEPPTVEAQASQPASSPFQARTFTRTLSESWNLGSFSAMIRNRPDAGDGADHDADAGHGGRGAMPSLIPGDDALRFPAGAEAGSCIHTLFELANFSQPESAEDAIHLALARHPLPPAQRSDGPEVLAARLRSLLRNVLSTPLPRPDAAPLRLSSLAPADCLHELRFTLAGGPLAAEAVNAFLRDQGYELPPLSFRTIQGYLTGAIDLVLRADGRYYLLDWKSNHLGHEPGDYAPAALAEVMREERYTLQYLIYCLALHRHLRARLPGYDYLRDFGGVYYLFVRAVRPDWAEGQAAPPGVFFDRPDPDVIAALDALLGQTAPDSPVCLSLEATA
jgi:exodeoxyribonuclease V beta subunit